MKFPSPPSKGRSVIEIFNEIIAYLRSSRITSVVGGKLRAGPNGTVLVIDRPKTNLRRGGNSSATCPFGRVISYTVGTGESAVSKTGIAGGIIYCGDKTWNFDPFEINLETDVDWMMRFEIDATVNTDDDDELLLPNVKTGTRPTEWSHDDYAEDYDYPDNTNPSIPSGDGTIIVPLGRLTVAGGAATFIATGCGNITITHCAGTLSHTRG